MLSPSRHLQFLKITSWMILAMVLIIPIQVIIFMVSPMPETTVSWVELFSNQPLMGLLHMDLLYIINNSLLIFFYIALYMTLKKSSPSLNLIALTTGLIGAVLYYTSNRSIEMLMLSQRFFLETDPAMISANLALAESYLDIWKGTSFTIYYILSAISLILFSITILEDSFYSRKTGIWGLISGILMIIPSNVGMIGLVMSLLSLIPWIVFSILVLMRLFRIDEKELMDNQLNSDSA